VSSFLTTTWSWTASQCVPPCRLGLTRLYVRFSSRLVRPTSPEILFKWLHWQQSNFRLPHIRPESGRTGWYVGWSPILRSPGFRLGNLLSQVERAGSYRPTHCASCGASPCNITRCSEVWLVFLEENCYFCCPVEGMFVDRLSLTTHVTWCSSYLNSRNPSSFCSREFFLIPASAKVCTATLMLNLLC
jgi:hypothetical protein